MLHIDLKELVISIGGFRYVVFAIDEYTRYVFVDFIKVKSDLINSYKRLAAAFNATADGGAANNCVANSPLLVAPLLAAPPAAPTARATHHRCKTAPLTAPAEQ